MLPLLFTAFLAVHTYGNAIVTRQLATGVKQCSTTMCISAALNGSNVEYVLSSTGKATLGWMGIGFGQQMADTPMVIMWPNSDGTATLSQRTAPREVQPTLDTKPPRVATLSESLTTTSGSTPSFGFTIPSNGETKQTVIFAFSSTPPSSSAADASLMIHSDNGVLHLNLPGSGSATPPDGGSSFPSDGRPLLPFQRLVIAHAIFCVVGFLLFLPAGALLARYLRTFSPKWFTGHWVIQFAISGPTIVIGISLGYKAVTDAGGSHFNDPHKQLGLALFGLYAVQCALGAIIHFVKAKNRTRRPIQNYMHAVIGLITIALAMYQVYLGFKKEWPKTTGLEPFPQGVTIFYYFWVVILPVLYFGGLSLLPRQYRQESKSRQPAAVKYDDADEPEYRDSQ